MSRQLEVVARAERGDLRRRVRAVENELFRVVQLRLEADREALASALLVCNSVLMLRGLQGSGKSSLVRCIARGYFSDGEVPPDMAVVNCHQHLTDQEILYSLDLGALNQGRELVREKRTVTARLKFLNEIQRAPEAVHNALFPLLAEGEVHYCDQRFQSPRHICIMDCNPADTASVELTPAFLDRVDYGFLLPVPRLKEALAIAELRTQGGRTDWAPLQDFVGVHLGVDALEEAWDRVPEVKIPIHTRLYAHLMLGYFSACVREDRSLLNPHFELDCAGCSYRGEACSHLEEVFGQRPMDSLLRLGQAQAWRHGRETVAVQDLMKLLPYVLGHRIRLRRDLLRTVPSELSWVEDTAVREMLASKEQSWRKAVTATLRGQRSELEALKERDLAIRELLLCFEEPEMQRLRGPSERQQVLDLLRKGVLAEGEDSA